MSEHDWVFRWLPFRKLNWRYMGSVQGSTTIVDKDGAKRRGGQLVGYWILSERDDGERRSKLVGDPGGSANANYAAAQVEAWVLGGPYPVSAAAKEEPTPEKPKAKLIVFPGGKEA